MLELYQQTGDEWPVGLRVNWTARQFVMRHPRHPYGVLSVVDVVRQILYEIESVALRLQR